MAGATGSVTTSAGNWTFNPANPPSANYCVFLNGSFVGEIGATEMAVENQGNLYAYNGGAWYKWNGATFVQTADSNLPSPPGSASNSTTGPVTTDPTLTVAPNSGPT